MRVCVCVCVSVLLSGALVIKNRLDCQMAVSSLRPCCSMCPFCDSQCVVAFVLNQLIGSPWLIQVSHASLESQFIPLYIQGLENT